MILNNKQEQAIKTRQWRSVMISLDFLLFIEKSIRTFPYNDYSLFFI